MNGFQNYLNSQSAITQYVVLTTFFTVNASISSSTATAVVICSRDTAGSLNGCNAITSVLIDPLYTGSPVKTGGRDTLINV